MPIDLSEVALDPDLGQPFTVIRSTGQFGLGGWIANAPTSIPAFGIIAVADDQALEPVPEGDRVKGSLQVITTTPIYPTLASNSATSDQIQWSGDYYRVQHVGPWFQNGFYSAIIVRVTGN